VKLRSCQAELTQKGFEPVLIPTRVSLPPFHNKSGIFSNPVSQGFIKSQNGLGINEFDNEDGLDSARPALEPSRIASNTPLLGQEDTLPFRPDETCGQAPPDQKEFHNGVSDQNG